MSSASKNLMTLADADVMGTPLPTPTLPLLDHWLPHSSGDRPARAEQRDRAARATVPGVANRWLCLQHREKEGAAVEGRPVTGARASMYRGRGWLSRVRVWPGRVVRVCVCGGHLQQDQTATGREERDKDTQTERQRQREVAQRRAGGVTRDSCGSHGRRAGSPELQEWSGLISRAVQPRTAAAPRYKLAGCLHIERCI